jgi:hypothetical protein
MQNQVFCTKKRGGGGKKKKKKKKKKMKKIVRITRYMERLAASYE